MVRNFNELVLQQARIEDRIDRIGRQKAKQILDEKRERQVGLSRTGELFEPITKRLDIAHKYRRGERTKEEKELEKKKMKEDKEMKALIDEEMAGAEGPGAEGPGAEGPGAEGPGAEGPGVDPKEFEKLKKLVEGTIAEAKGGVTEERVEELVGESLRNLEDQVAAMPGGVSEERLKEVNKKQMDDFVAMIGNFKIPSSMTEAEVEKIVEKKMARMEEKIEKMSSGTTKDEVKAVVKEELKGIIDEIKELKEKKEHEEGAFGGVDPDFPEKFKLTPPGTPVAVSPSQQPETSTPQNQPVDWGSPLMGRRQTTPSSVPSASSGPHGFQQQGSVEEDRAEGLSGETTSGEESGDESFSASDESEEGGETEGYETEKIGAELKAKDLFKELGQRLIRKDILERIGDDGKGHAYESGPYAFLTGNQLKEISETPEKKRKGKSPFKIAKSLGNKPYGLGDIFYGWNEEGRKLRKKAVEKIKKTEKSKDGKKKKGSIPKQGSGLNNSLTESERLKAFAIIKRNIGSINAGNTSKQSVQQTINAIQLLFLSQEITNQQRINLLQKLKSAIR